MTSQTRNDVCSVNQSISRPRFPISVVYRVPFISYFRFFSAVHDGGLSNSPLAGVLDRKQLHRFSVNPVSSLRCSLCMRYA
jgi:hypothetical protein